MRRACSASSASRRTPRRSLAANAVAGLRRRPGLPPAVGDPPGARQPARVVIAAPYVETAVAFGSGLRPARAVAARAACGLRPRPDVRGLRARAQARRRLEAAARSRLSGILRRAVRRVGAEAGVEADPARHDRALDRAAEGPQASVRLSDQGRAELREDVTGSRPAARRPVCFATSQCTIGNARGRKRQQRVAIGRVLGVRCTASACLPASRRQSVELPLHFLAHPVGGGCRRFREDAEILRAGSRESPACSGSARSRRGAW